MRQLREQELELGAGLVPRLFRSDVRGRGLEPEVLHLDRLAGGEQEGPGEHRLELRQVSRPGMRREMSKRARAEARGGPPPATREHTERRLRERRKIPRAGGEGRHLDDDRREAPGEGARERHPRLDAREHPDRAVVEERLQRQRRLGRERPGVEVERRPRSQAGQGWTPAARRDEGTAATGVGVERPRQEEPARGGGHGEEDGNYRRAGAPRDRHEAGCRRRQAGRGQKRRSRRRVERWQGGPTARLSGQRRRPAGGSPARGSGW